MPPALLAQEHYNPLPRSSCSFKPAFTHQTDSHDGLQAFHPVWARFCSPKVAISPRMPGISPFMQHTFGRFPLWWVNIFIYQGKYSHTHAISLNNPSHQLKPKADELPFLLLGASKAPEIFFKGVCFDLNLIAQSWLCLFFNCLFATLWQALGFANC